MNNELHLPLFVIAGLTRNPGESRRNINIRLTI